MGELRGLVTDDEEGVFNVSTDDGATHRLDLNRRTVTTRTADVPATDGTPASRPVRIVAVVTCRVGHPMVVLIDRGVPGVSFTHRTTPPVVSIHRVRTAMDQQPPKEEE